MRLVIARCSVDYAGRLSAHLPLATRLLIHKSDGSLLEHADALSLRPLDWVIIALVFGSQFGILKPPAHPWP
jgi:RecB family endonuclease NucS